MRIIFVTMYERLLQRFQKQTKKTVLGLDSKHHRYYSDLMNTLYEARFQEISNLENGIRKKI